MKGHTSNPGFDILNRGQLGRGHEGGWAGPRRCPPDRLRQGAVVDACWDSVSGRSRCQLWLAVELTHSPALVSTDKAQTAEQKVKRIEEILAKTGDEEAS